MSVTAAAAALAAGVVLAGCGGSRSAAGAAASERAAEHKSETRFEEFAKCLREHGVDAEARSPSGGPNGIKISPGRGGATAMEAAEKACRAYRPEPKRTGPPSPEDVQHEQALLEFAKCMRGHGFDAHAELRGGSLGIFIRPHPGSRPNPENPVFQAAQKACSGLVGAGPR